MSKSIYAKLSAKISQENKKIQERAERSGQSFEKIEYFKPKIGENMIRLIPNLENPENTFVVVKLHWLPGVSKAGKKYKAPVRCLEDFGEKCPACKEYRRLMDEGSKDEASQYRAKETYLYNILDYASKKILPYAMPSKAHETIMSYFEDFRDSMFDLDEGRDWKLIKKVDPSKGPQFGTEYTVRPQIKESSVPEKLRALLEEIKDVASIYPEDGAEDSKKQMLKLLGNDSEEDEEEEPAPKKKSSFSKSSPAKNKYEDEEDEDEEYVKKPVKKASKYVEEDEDEDEEEYVPKKKAKGKIEVEDDLEDEINALLEDDE